MAFSATAHAAIDLISIGGQPVTFSAWMRTREYVWSYFQPGVIGGKSYENRYNYQANSLRFGLGYKIKGIKFFLEAMNPTLFDLPSHGLAPSPAGALGLGANYFAIQKEGLESNLFLKQGYLESADSAIEGLDVKGGRFEFNEGQDLMPKDPQLRWVVTNQIAQRLIGNFGAGYGSIVETQPLPSDVFLCWALFRWFGGGRQLSGRKGRNLRLRRDDPFVLNLFAGLGLRLRTELRVQRLVPAQGVSGCTGYRWNAPNPVPRDTHAIFANVEFAY